MIEKLKNPKLLIAAVAGIGVLAFLAFGVFGIQTAFIDDVVNEENPFAVAATGDGTSDVGSADGAETDDAASSDDEMAEDSESDVAASADSASEEEAEPQILTVVEGSFIDHDHPTSGTAVVLSDGNQRFLRFEDDFVSDNGPDLNVYLVAGVPAEGPAGEFDDDFIDLGDLKGNIGAQNYEIPPEVDLEVYNTVVIWCVRFGVAFGAADLV